MRGQEGTGGREREREREQTVGGKGGERGRGVSKERAGEEGERRGGRRGRKDSAGRGDREGQRRREVGGWKRVGDVTPRGGAGGGGGGKDPAHLLIELTLSNISLVSLQERLCLKRLYRENIFCQNSIENTFYREHILSEYRPHFDSRTPVPVFEPPLHITPHTNTQAHTYIIYNL
jgi:hypothetical protein